MVNNDFLKGDFQEVINFFGDVKYNNNAIDDDEAKNKRAEKFFQDITVNRF